MINERFIEFNPSLQEKIQAAMLGVNHDRQELIYTVDDLDRATSWTDEECEEILDGNKEVTRLNIVSKMMAILTGEK